MSAIRKSAMWTMHSATGKDMQKKKSERATQKKVQHEKSATWTKVQHETVEHEKMCNMKRVHHEKSSTIEVQDEHTAIWKT